MEGLADVHLRRLLTAQGGFDWVVSEFVRVVDKPLPDHVFHRICPELEAGGKTRSGTPVRVQLLGNHLEAMAANAHRAAELGAFGIDINFGCPSKTVNRSQGGAVLLKEPETLYRVVKAVREALPKAVIVSPGIRPGGHGTDDHKRSATPGKAIGMGSDWLVVGRPIRDADDPRAVAEGIVAEIEAAAEAVAR